MCFELVQDDDDSKHWVDMPNGANGQALADIVRAKLALPAADRFVLVYLDKVIDVRTELCWLCSPLLLLCT